MDEVLEESWLNIQMLSATIPTYDNEEKEEKKGMSWGSVIEQLKGNK